MANKGRIVLWIVVLAVLVLPSGLVLAQSQVWEDGEGLVRVEATQTEVSLFFDLALWEETYGILDWVGDTLQTTTLRSGPHPVADLAGKVKDVAIGEVQGLDWVGYPHFSIPIVVFVLEDGRVQWLAADPYESPANIYGLPLFYRAVEPNPFLKEIESVWWSLESEDFILPTIYAQDQAGLRYNLRYALSLADLFEGHWVCRMEEEDIYGFLRFFPDGTLTLSIGSYNFSQGMGMDEEYENWRGSYELFLVEEQSVPAGMFFFDLELQRGQSLEGQDTIVGGYWVEPDVGRFSIVLVEGDALYLPDGRSANHPWYDLWFEMIPKTWETVHDLSLEELTAYLLQEVPRAYNLVVHHDLAVLISGETTDCLEEATCRQIWLGTDHPEHFVREILFAIGDSGLVYEYDPLHAKWNISNR